MDNFLKIDFEINPELDKIADTPLASDKFKAAQGAFIDAFPVIEKYCSSLKNKIEGQTQLENKKQEEEKSQGEEAF